MLDFWGVVYRCVFAYHSHRETQVAPLLVAELVVRKPSAVMVKVGGVELARAVDGRNPANHLKCIELCKYSGIIKYLAIIGCNKSVNLKTKTGHVFIHTKNLPFKIFLIHLTTVSRAHICFHTLTEKKLTSCPVKQ